MSKEASSGAPAHGRLKWVLVVSALAPVGVAVYALLVRPPTPEAAGRRMIVCTLAGDAGCLLRFTTEREKKGLGLNDQTMGRFLQTIVRPRLGAFVRDGDIKVDSGGPSVSVLQPMRAPDGRRAELEFVLEEGPNGPKALNVVAGLFKESAAATWPAGKPFPHGREKSAFWGASAGEMMQQLEATGVNGLVLGVPPKDTFYTWEAYRARELAVANPPLRR